MKKGKQIKSTREAGTRHQEMQFIDSFPATSKLSRSKCYDEKRETIKNHEHRHNMSDVIASRDTRSNRCYRDGATFLFYDLRDETHKRCHRRFVSHLHMSMTHNVSKFSLYYIIVMLLFIFGGFTFLAHSTI